MSTDKYILNDQGEPVPEPNLHKWGSWMQNTKGRVVKKETIGDSEVSTVFLGLDHSFGDTSEPILWETMVFDGKLDQEQDRCPGNRADAIKMHERMVERVNATAR